MPRDSESNRLFAGVLGLALALLGILCARILRDWNDIEAELARVPPAVAIPPARQVKLANRARLLPAGRRLFPARLTTAQTPSSRGTVPYVLVSEAPVSGAVRERARQAGARVLGFLPVNALLVELDEKALAAVRDDVLFAGAFEFSPEDKIQKGLLAAAEPLRVAVAPVEADDAPAIAAFLASAGATVLAPDSPGVRLQAVVRPALLPALARRGDVRWIERGVPPKLQNDVAVRPGLMNVRPVLDAHGLTGRGQYLTCADSGLDSGDPQTVMDDFTGRIVAIRRATDETLPNDIHGHGTHVAGSLVGTGKLSDGEIRGVAHDARLWMWGCMTATYGLAFPDWPVLFRPETNLCPAYVHSESWGSGDASAYTLLCQSADEWLWRHPEHLAVFAVGNEGKDRSIAAPAGAKNVLAVGATESLRPDTVYGKAADNAAQMASFSSRGPMADGRIKPDLCAPGTMILSTRTREIPPSETVGWLSHANTNYTYNSGTSMATPLVAGAAALTREWLVERRGFTNGLPTAALMKAVLTGGARDLSGDAAADCGGAAPNSCQGWGRVDLGESLYPSNRAVRLWDRIAFAAGSESVFRVAVTNSAPLDVQLVWLDYPAEPSAAQALVNDLDLVVSNETTGAVWPGNGVPGGDRTNTVESVRLAQADAGTYAIRVRGHRVPYDSTEGGAAAVYVRGAFAGDAETAAAGESETGTLPVRYRSQFPQLDSWGATVTAMVASGQVVRVSIPADLPDGDERLTGFVWTDETTGLTTPLEEQRLAEVAVDGEVLYDEKGRMPRSFDVKVDAARDVQFRYYGVTATNGAAGLPEWWYRRYLLGATAGTGLGRADADADGDGLSNADEYAADTDPVDPDSDFRILAVTAERLVWRGGCERTQVVERTAVLAPGAVWHGVFTNLPPTPVEGRYEFPKGLTNSFYRIRAF
ncbi:MAG: S8 family serine peptidase [Kiritimatiellia bacterium]